MKVEKGLEDGHLGVYVSKYIDAGELIDKTG